MLEGGLKVGAKKGLTEVVYFGTSEAMALNTPLLYTTIYTYIYIYIYIVCLLSLMFRLMIVISNSNRNTLLPAAGPGTKLRRTPEKREKNLRAVHQAPAPQGSRPAPPPKGRHICLRGGLPRSRGNSPVVLTQILFCLRILSLRIDHNACDGRILGVRWGALDCLAARVGPRKVDREGRLAGRDVGISLFEELGSRVTDAWRDNLGAVLA